MWSKQWFENAGYTVLYGDTDSLFVRSGMADAESARAQGTQLAVKLNETSRATSTSAGASRAGSS